MPSLLPSPADDYAAPQDMRLNKAAWDAALVSVGLRLRALEAIKADFEALIALGTGQALEVIQANVAPQLAALRQTLAILETEIAQAQDQIHDIVSGSVPASAVTETANRLWLTPALKARIEAAAALDGPAFAGSPTAPTAPAGTATGQIATTAHVAQTLAALGGAGNRLPNASGAAGLAGVSIWGPPNMTSGIAGVLGEHSVWVPPGVNGWFLIQWDEATVYSWFDFVDGAGNPFPVQPGELYQFSISTGNHRALQIYVDLVWLDAAGTVMGTSNSIGGTNAAGATVIAFSGANGGASPEAPSGQRFEDARRLWVISTAPPGAVRVTPRVVKGPTKPGQGTSAMFGYRPYFGEAAPGQMLPSAWSDGTATSEIRAAVDALSASLSAAQAAALATRLRVDAGQAFTDGQKAQGRQNLAAAAASDALRNRIINGAMRVSQEWGSTPVSGGLGYAADQWESAASGSGFACTHAQVQGATPGGASHRLRITITAAKAALSDTDALAWTQALEGQQVADLQWGTGSARQALARFGFRGPAGTYSFAIRNGTPDRAYLAGFVIPAGQANLDTLQSFVIPGDLAGTWATGPTRGLMFSICLAASAAVTGGPGWQSGNLLAVPGQSNGLASTANVFELFDAGLYVDIGNTGVLPVWQMPDPLDELRKSQRYYWKLDTPITASSLMVAGIYHGYQATLFHPVEMRVPPSVSANLTDYLNLYSWSITAGVRHAQVNLQADATANGMSLVVVNAGSLFNARM